MSHLLQSRAHYGCRGNVVCSDLLCLMADIWTEMEMSQRHTKKPSPNSLLMEQKNSSTRESKNNEAMEEKAATTTSITLAKSLRRYKNKQNTLHWKENP